MNFKEVAPNEFVNMQNVFVLKIEQIESKDEYIVRFYPSNGETIVASRKFETEIQARDWLNTLFNN